jgi:hypothetical protein
MLCVGFEPTIPTSERAETVHASDSSATLRIFLLLFRLELLMKISVYFIHYETVYCSAAAFLSLPFLRMNLRM